MHLIMENKRIDINKLGKIFAEVVQQIRSIGIPISNNLDGPVINRRARTRFGCCKVHREDLGKTVYKIEISDYMLCAEEKYIKEVIAHELLHTCKGCLNHGKKWKEYAALLNKHFGYNISRVSSYQSMGLPLQRDSESRVARYILVCQKCGGEIHRIRRSKLTDNPENYRCGKCGGELKLITQSTTSCG